MLIEARKKKSLLSEVEAGEGGKLSPRCGGALAGARILISPR